MARDIVGRRKRDKVQIFVDRLPFQVLQIEGGEVDPGATHPSLPDFQLVVQICHKFSGNSLSQLDAE